MKVTREAQAVVRRSESKTILSAAHGPKADPWSAKSGFGCIHDRIADQIATEPSG
jgi:hypothetical protein